MDGDGLRDAMADMLADQRLTAPFPRGAGGAVAADADQSGDPALDTADWQHGAPGDLQVRNALPAAT
jgi:hypothetical protein